MKRRVQFFIISAIILLLSSSISLSSSKVCLDDLSFKLSDNEGPAISAFSMADLSSFTRNYRESVDLYVTDEDGVDQVWCYYGINGTDDWTNVSMERAFGDTYSCVVSGYLDSFATKWLFQFSANDTTGARSTYNRSVTVYFVEPTRVPDSWYEVTLLITGVALVICTIVASWWYKKRR